MKKILTVSLVAIMAVSAARADIASVQYVDNIASKKANTADVEATYATKQEISDLDVGALEGRVEANETAITALQGADTTINTELAKKIDATTVASTYATQATVNDMDAAYKLADQNINTELAKKIDTTTVESTYATKQEISDLDVGALEGRVEANEGAITALQGADTQINADIALKADKTTVEAIDGRVGANETAITALQGADTAINTELANKADTTYVNEELGKKQNSLPAKPDYCSGKECALVMDKEKGELTWRVVVYQESDKTTPASI